MGSSPPSLYPSLYLKGMILHNKCKLKSLNGSPWCKALKASPAMRRRQGKGRVNICKKHRRMLMKKRISTCKRPDNGIERRIRTLKKLVPNGNKSTGLDGLFRETDGFIMCLQMKVKIMQTAISLLSPSDE